MGWKHLDEGSADHVIERAAGHVGELTVAIKDGAIVLDCGGAFVHGFHQQPVRALSAFEGENLISVRSADDKGVDFTITNRGEGLFRDGETGAQFNQLVVGFLRSCAGTGHSAWRVLFGASMLTPRPIRIFWRSDMSPMKRRMGKGKCFTSVGEAMTSPSRARAGCW